MQKLLRLLIKNHVLLLFLLLEVIAFSLLFNKSFYQRSKFVGFAEQVQGGYYSQVHFWGEYFSLREQNERLAQENTYLRNKLQAYNDYDAALFFGVTDTLYRQHYYYLSAKVINNSVNKQHNFITLNKGSEMGVEPEMAVISNNGVVGVVSNVSRKFSTVISLLNTDLNISAKFKKNNYFGSLSWDGVNYDRAVLSEIPYHVDVAVGDTIITSGYSTIFPEGELLGTVKKFEVKDGNFYSIVVDLSTDFKNINFVKVVSNLKKEEQVNIESTHD